MTRPHRIPGRGEGVATIQPADVDKRILLPPLKRNKYGSEDAQSRVKAFNLRLVSTSFHTIHNRRHTFSDSMWALA